MKQIVLGLGSALLITTSAWAIDCHTETDCATLGYNSSTNTGGCLKCPFGNKWACSCTPLPSETNCPNGTTTADDGCGGTRTVCKECTPRQDGYLYSCPNSYVTYDNRCGGTYKYCPEKGCNSRGYLYGSGDCFKSTQSGYGKLVGVVIGYKDDPNDAYSKTKARIVDLSNSVAATKPTRSSTYDYMCLGDYPDGLAGADYYKSSSNLLEECMYTVSWDELLVKQDGSHEINTFSDPSVYAVNLSTLKKAYSDDILNRFYFAEKVGSNSYKCYNFVTNEVKTITEGDGQTCYTIFAGNAGKALSIMFYLLVNVVLHFLFLYSLRPYH